MIPPSPSVATLGAPLGAHLGAPLGAHLGAAYGRAYGAPLGAHLGAPLGAPWASRLVSPGLLSGVVGPSVLSLPSVAAHHVTVARPSAVAVERVDVGSVPSVSVVNEPTTIVTPGKPIRGHSFTSEVFII